MPKSPDKSTNPPKKPEKKRKDYARPTRAKAHRPDAPAHDPALDDLLNPAIGKGRAVMGSGTGLQQPPTIRSTAAPATRPNTPRASPPRRVSARSRNPAMSRATPPERVLH